MITPQQLSKALGQQHLPTEEQAAIIAAPAGPMVVVAGAGSGKTETMAARVVWLVANRLVQPDQVLGLTFTRKAAQQLTARIRTRLAALAEPKVLRTLGLSSDLGDELLASEPTVSTYHSYAGRLLGEHGLLLPIEPASELLTETQMWQIAYRVVSDYDGELTKDVQPKAMTENLLALASSLAEHLVDAADLERVCRDVAALIYQLPRGSGGLEPNATMKGYANSQLQRLELLPVLERLRAAMRQRRALDFGSQMSLAAQVALKHSAVGVAERAKFRVVLLDEYQDTGHSQRILLRALFGGGQDGDLSVTAVGDPMQSIYGWRGASAANLPRFRTDFPQADGSPSPVVPLATSWRNPPNVLRLANAIADPLRNQGVPVATLRARPEAPDGDIRIGLLETADAERDWLAASIAQLWSHAAADGKPTTAVLVRRNADAAPIAERIRAQGIPVQIVGLSGLLYTPEVADVVATLRIIANPAAGPAAMRILTGARWRLGAADLKALTERAGELSIARAQIPNDITTAEVLTDALRAGMPSDLAERAGIVEALADPGPPESYSRAGFARVGALSDELQRLRERADSPLPELVADIERSLLLAVEANGSPNLDAFADVVARFAADPAATVDAFLAFLDAALEVEDGLPLGEVEVSTDAVQILSIHASKGLEWQVVAIPHVSKRLFASENSMSTWLTGVQEIPVPLRGDRATVGADGVPDINLESATDRMGLQKVFDQHRADLRHRRDDEERRLCYVALTRTERVLMVSGSHWEAGQLKPRGASDFLTELAVLVDPFEWADTPSADAANPLDEQARSLAWPFDPLGARRAAVRAGADRVLAALAKPPSGIAALENPTDEDPDGWSSAVDAALAQRDSTHHIAVALPSTMSTTAVVRLGADRNEFLEQLRRPMPTRPNPLARRGTAFHAWIEARFGATRLFDVDELPGAADAEQDEDLASLQQSFLASAWADRDPIEVEAPFETTIGGHIIRGRIDAVFAEPDGGWLVVDWKTGAVPTGKHREDLARQLAVYRLAWARLLAVREGSSVPQLLPRVRAAFHYVRHDETIMFDHLPDARQLDELIFSADAVANDD